MLFYQHDLAPETFTVDKETLIRNLAFGYMLSYDLVESTFGGSLDSEWLRLAATFQQNVLARYADEAMMDYRELADGVTQTSFETCTVIANWDEGNEFTAGENTLPPGGVQVSGANGTLTAGVFTRYNGLSLSAGDHYLIVDHSANEIAVHQPVGADTQLTLDLPPDWDPGDSIQAWAYAAAGRPIGSVSITVTAQDITFVYQQKTAEQTVAFYKIFKPGNIFLPLVLLR